MSYLLDTNTCSAYLKGNGEVFNRIVQYAGRLYVSTVSVGELYSWMLRAKTKRSYAEGLDDLLKVVHLLPLDHAVAHRFGAVRAALLDAGRPVPEMDLLIGATALVHDLTVATGNVRDFGGIPNLRVENWLAR